MKDTPDKKNTANNLREQAENKITNDPTHIELMFANAEALKLAHELEIHKIELEMQNEELINTRLATQRAIDLYDLAPAGYFTLSKESKIIRVNINGSNLLNKDQKTLIDSMFLFFVTEETKPVFTDFIERIYDHTDTQSCEIKLSISENTELYVYLTGKRDKKEELCLITAIDITERKLNEEMLRHEREIFLDIVNNQPAGIYRIRVFRPDKWLKDAWNSSENPPYKMELASDRFCEIIGKSREEFEDNPAIIIDLIHPEDKADFVSKNEIANNTVIPFNWNGRLIIHEKISWVHLESIPRLLASGDILWTGILYDINDQKQKERELTESENKYRELVDNSPDAIGIYSDGKIVFMNNECLHLMGATTAEELMGKQVIEFVHPDYREFALERMMSVINGGKALPLEEEKFIRLDGTTIDVEVKSMPIIFQDKKSIQIIVRDITERKRAEWLLIQSEERFQQLFNKAPLGYQSLDYDGNLIDVNQQWLDMLGYEREEVLGRKFESIISGEYQAGIHNCFSIMESQGRIYKELEIIHKNGTKLFIAIDGRVGYDVQGNFKQTHCILQDITLRRIAENELKKSRQDFKDLFEFAPVGYHEIDAEGRIVRINKTELTMLGYSLEELKGQFVWKISADEEQSFKAAKEKLQGKNIPLKSFNREFRRKDGSTFPVQIQDRAIRDKEGKVTGIRSTIQDITERVKAENELTRSREDFKTLFEYAPVGYHEIDSEGRIVRMNQTELAMLGYTHEEVKGQYIWNFFENEAYSHKRTKEKLEGKLISSKPYERVIIHKNKSTITVLLQDKIIKSPDGIILGTRSSVQDISERKQAEVNLQVSEVKFRNIFENSIVGKSMTSLDGNMNVNKAFSQIVGYTEEELFQLNWEDITHQDDLEYNKNETRLMLDGKKTFSHWEKRYIHKNGHIVWVDISIFLLRDIQGKPTHFITEIYDITDRKKAETDLRQSEDKFKKAFMTSPDSVTINNLEEGIYVSINSGFTRIMGYQPEEVLGRSSIEINMWADINDRDRFVAVLKENGIVENFITQFRNKSGGTVYGMVSASLIELAGSLHIISITRDITELKNTELALQQSEERFKVLFEDAPDSMFLADPETGKIIDANAAACRLFKKQKQELVGVNQYELHPAEDTDMSIENFKNHITQSQTLDTTIPVENTILCSDGTVIPVEILAHSITIDGNTFILGTFRDISERKKAEQLILENEERYRLISSVVSDYIFTTKLDENGNLSLTWVTGAFQDITGYTFEEYIAAGGWIGTLHPDDLEKDQQDLEELKKNHTVVSDIRTIAKNGDCVWVRIYAHPIWDYQANKLTSIYGGVKDITKSKLTEIALQESEKLYHNLVLRIPDGVYKSTAGGKFIDVNPAMVKMLGYGSKEELLAVDIKSQLYFESSDRDYIVLNSKNEELSVFPLKKKDGSEIWIEDHGWYNSDREGNIVTHEGVLRDITDRKLAQDALQEREKMLKKTLVESSGLIDNSSEGMDYNKMSDTIREISGAKYVGLNIFSENGLDFTTVALSGIKDHILNASKYLGFEVLHKKWKYDPLREGKTQGKAITRFDSIKELASFVLPKKASTLLEKIFNLGELYVVKISKKNHVIGDFTLVFSKGDTLQNSELVLLYANQLALYIDRDKADKELRVNEEKYRYLFENNPQPMWIYDQETLDFIEVNLAATNHYGYTREEFLLMKITDIRPPEDIPALIMDVSNREVNMLFAGEWRHTKKNGENIIVDISSVSVISNGRNARHVMVQDITERKLAENALKESEDKYRTMIENSNDLIWTLDKAGLFTFMNGIALKTTGLKQDDWIGKSFEPLVPEEDQPMLKDIFSRTLNGESCTYELRFKKTEEQILTILVNTSAVYIAGKIEGVVSFGQDITESKKSLIMLRESEEKFRSIAEQTSDLITITDDKGILIYASTASKSIFNYLPEEMCGHNFINYLDESSIKKAKAIFWKNIESKESINNLELKMKRKDGSLFYGELNGSSFKYGDNYGTLVVIRDMTERKKAQEEIEQKMNELVRFHNLTVDREMTMIELKKEINELLKKTGQEEKYTIVT
ncbi:MAG: PAS domain S-box protein [Paludibacter sp.]|nr:PAS domain S-box protein [Paludibacter sp.]